MTTNNLEQRSLALIWFTLQTAQIVLKLTPTIINRYAIYLHLNKSLVILEYNYYLLLYYYIIVLYVTEFYNAYIDCYKVITLQNL